MSARLLPLLLALCAGPARAEAPDSRLLLAVSSHHGTGPEARLRYAARDARRVVAVLSDLGGVGPADTAVLVDPTPAELRRALRTAQARVGQLHADGRRTTLVFYYSGHADRRGLHLGAASFAHAELRQGIRDTGAQVRVLVLAACESGGITTKGVVPVEPFSLSVDGGRSSSRRAPRTRPRWSPSSSAARSSPTTWWRACGARRTRTTPASPWPRPTATPTG